MSKSRDAFRTISEVSSTLDTPAHVLRFWESKFTQVKPVKRAGGRRYYRPADVNLLAGIKQLLHEDGMTIKGAQKLLREQGVKHVAKLGETVLMGPSPVDVTPAEDAESKQDAPIEAATPVTPAAQETPLEAAPATPVAETPKPPEDAQIAASHNEAPHDAPTDPSKANIDITNVVTMPSKAPTADSGPALTLNVGSKDKAIDPAVEETAKTSALVMPDVPTDPSDNESKAPARLFHLLQRADYSKLAKQSETIAPLLDRMQVLRDRISPR